MTTLKDDFGRAYKVSNLEAFRCHIEKYHTNNGKVDGSLHEENGYWFSITDDFYQYIRSL